MKLRAYPLSTYGKPMNLTKEEELEMDKEIANNRAHIKFGVLFVLFYLSNSSKTSAIDPVEGFSPKPIIIRNGKDPADSAKSAAAVKATKKDPADSAKSAKSAKYEKSYLVAQEEEDCQKFPERFKVYLNMSPRLSKLSQKFRKDQDTCNALNKLREQLKYGSMHAGRGSQKLKGVKGPIFYMRSGAEARVYYQYSKKNPGAIVIVAESEKDHQLQVISNLKASITTPNYDDLDGLKEYTSPYEDQAIDENLEEDYSMDLNPSED